MEVDKTGLRYNLGKYYGERYKHANINTFGLLVYPHAPIRHIDICYN